MKMRSLVMVVASLSQTLPATSADARPVIYAHRGGAGIAPENTLGAFRQAHELFGARGVWLEMDVQLAKDGVLVVMHDATVDRTTDCSGRVVDHTSVQLHACDARGVWTGWPTLEPVPTFRAVLDEGKARGWRILPEIKNIPGEPNFDPSGERAAVALIADVAAAGFDPGRLAVQSFFPTSLDTIELRAPAIATVLLTTSRLPGAPPSVGFYVTENAVFSRVRGYEAAAPDHEAPDMRAESIMLAHAIGMPVVVWTVDDGARMSELAGFGVDGIITNRPDIAFDTIG